MLSNPTQLHRSTNLAFSLLPPPSQPEVTRRVSAQLFWVRHNKSEQSSFTYISLKGTETKAACLIVRDKERLENGHAEMNYDIFDT